MLIIADSKTPLSREAFAQLGELRQLATKEIDHEAIRDAGVLIVRSETRVDRRLLEGTQVRFVGTATIGTDHIDLEYLARCGIGFASAPGSNANSVAEYVAAALLELEGDGKVRLEGALLGVVGVGNVGSKVLRVAHALGMRTLLNDPPLARATGDARYVPLDALMDADVVTLHVPFTRHGPDPTEHLFDDPRLAKMKRGSILINTSRGGVVEGGALQEALRKGLAGAVLDVWEREPNIDAGLLSTVTLGTPHIAGYSRDGKQRAAQMIYEAAFRFFHIPPAPQPEPPPSEGSSISIDPAVQGRHDLLRVAVRHCYDIRKDDRDLRNMLALPADRRAGHFRGLRAHYRVRKEFTNYSVSLASAQRLLGPPLASLGFRVRNEEA